MNDADALATAGRLQTLGIVVRSAELQDKAKAMNEFVANGGNRAMRRSRKRAQRGRGR